MKSARVLICLSFFLSSGAIGADKRLLDAEINAALLNQSLYAGEAGAIEQIFQNNGQTFYLENGASSQGFWSVRENQYCSTWPPNPTETCFDVIDRDGDIVFTAKSGKEFLMQRKK